MRLTNQILNRSCRAADFKNMHRNHWLCQEMIQFMKSQQAIGLSANQIGINLRLFVMQIEDRTRFCFNPAILDRSTELVTMAEGCLSFAGKQCILQRPEQIRVRYQDHRGFWIQEELTGLESRCFQHELDHLDGITMWDRYKEQHAEQSGN
jgi:peptide deformylase